MGVTLNVSPTIKIVEAYTDWTPPFDVKRAASKMLATIPPHQLVGLGSVVLIAVLALNRSRRLTIIGKDWWVVGRAAPRPDGR
jgi:hypothetical protein